VIELTVAKLSIDDVLEPTVAKSIEATNQLDTISEKSFTKGDITEIDEEIKVHFTYLEKIDESSV